MRKLNLKRFSEFEGTTEEKQDYFASLVKAAKELAETIEEWTPEIMETVKRTGKYSKNGVEFYIRDAYTSEGFDQKVAKTIMSNEQLELCKKIINYKETLVKKVI